MLRKVMMTAAFVGLAFVALPSFPSHAQGVQQGAGGASEMSAQAGTKGVGAARTSVGPGSDQGNPNAANSTGPGANPITQGPPKRHVRRHRRSTVGSK